MSTKTRALVGYAPQADGPPGPNWKLEDVELGPLQNGEVLVDMAATGICHTDIVLTSVPEGVFGISYPKIAGHEGSGYVKAVGSSCTKVKVGDPVLLSFDSCGKCSLCSDAHPAYCDEFSPRNYVGEQARFSAQDKGPIAGKFFGQSSFANLSMVSEASIVNAKSLIKNDDELRLFAPLGCGLQTGYSALRTIGRAQPSDRVAILGLGGVGMAAIMAAKIVGCKQIVGIDKVASRLSLAKDLGATDVVDTSKDPDIEAGLRKICKDGMTIILDTTGVPPLFEAALKALANNGKFVFIGITPPDYALKLPTIELINSGKSINGCILGDATPSKTIPEMIALYREGKFPFDKLTKIMPVEDYDKALHEMHDGSCIKPILRWA